MFFFQLLGAFAFAAIVMGRFPQESAPVAGLRAQLALAAPQARLAGQLARTFAAGRQVFRDGTRPPATLRH
jgi:hypothetical protein